MYWRSMKHIPDNPTVECLCKYLYDDGSSGFCVSTYFPGRGFAVPWNTGEHFPTKDCEVIIWCPIDEVVEVINDRAGED